MKDAPRSSGPKTVSEFGALIRTIFASLYQVDHAPRFRTLLLEIDKRSNAHCDESE